MKKLSLYLKKTMAALTSAAVLSVSVATSYYQPVQAFFLPAAVGVWEVVQWVLLSVGVTVMGYEIVSDIVDLAKTELYAEAVKGSLNDFKPGLGDEVLNQAEAALTSESVSISRETWSDLNGWAKSTFSSGHTVTIEGRSRPFPVNNELDIQNVIRYITGASNFTTFGASAITQFLRSMTDNSSLMTMVYFELGTSKYIYLIYNIDGSVFVPVIDIEPIDSNFVYMNLRDLNNKEFKMVFLYTTLNNIDQHNTSLLNNSMFRYRIQDKSLSFRETIKIGTDYKFDVIAEGSQAQVKIGVNTEIYPDYRDEVLEDNLDIVTPGTSVKDGVLTGDVVLPFPADLADILDDVKDGVQSIPDVLEDANVYPVDKTDEKAIEDALEKVGAVAGTVPAIGSYTLSLASFFPFCIPFDVIDMLECLAADPVAPSYTFSMPVGYDGKNVIYQEYTISLEMFDAVAQIVRTMETLLFMVGLAMVTRSLFIRS